MPTSHPSSPNLFSLGHFFAKNPSKRVDLTNLASNVLWSLLDNLNTPGVSNLDRIQSHTSLRLNNISHAPQPHTPLIDKHVLHTDMLTVGMS